MEPAINSSYGYTKVCALLLRGARDYAITAPSVTSAIILE
jgi:hypothetical protein